MKNVLILTVICLFNLSSLFSQKINEQIFDGEKNIPYSISFEKTDIQSTIPLLRENYFLDEGYSWIPQGKEIKDQLGIDHQRYQQTFDGIPIWAASISTHATDNQINSLSGTIVTAQPQIRNEEANIDINQAISFAMQGIGAKEYMWEDEDMECFIKEEQGDEKATFFPETKMIYFPLSYPSFDGELRLAYQLDIYAKSPKSRNDVLVDAITGEILFINSKICHIDEAGTVETAYSGNQPVTTYRADTNSNYELQDLSRGNGIFTYDCNNGTNYNTATIPTNVTNDWDYNNFTDNAILDAHWGTEQVYDYFSIQHNWFSYDNADSPLNSYVHYDFGYVNAFWDGSRMTYGDGDGVDFGPLTTITITGHEIAHGITENSAGLIYSYESGALNESFSDIFGASVRYFAKPNDFAWLIADEISLGGDPFRSMENPNLYGHPDTYLGNNWESTGFDNGGVHINSGVQNYWFFLISDGGFGTNDNGDSYSIQAIGKTDAAAIAFRTLTVYLSPSSNFAEARTFSIQSAEDLFGSCSNQVIAVTNAWHAVGVGDVFDSAIAASFNTSSNYSCTVPANIQFNNTSINGATYEWDFGDGNTSTTMSPSHTYNASGSYTVQLIVNGTQLCNSADTFTLAQPITVDNTSTVATPNCQPSPLNPITNGGITQFDLNSISNSSIGSIAGYEDFSCIFNTIVTEGLNYPINVQLNNNAYIGIWIDFDNDGDMTSSELVYTSTFQTTSHNTGIIMPATSNYNSDVRLRIISDTNPITTSCSVSNNGQVEDYSIRILENTNPPIANFIADITTALIGETISFQDLSLNLPTGWEWSFPGGDITTSTNQDQHVTYSTLGLYDVQLIATNAYGSDTLLIPNYINITNAFNLCDQTTTTSPSGIFYDTGGPNGSYGNNDYCTLLISPPCAQTITISFASFNVESGYDDLIIYDGNSTAAPLLGNFTGGGIPNNVTSTGSELFIVWDTDGSVTYSGFEASWSAVIGSQQNITTIASADASNPSFGQIVNFSDLSLEVPYSWLWDFGDGTTSTDQNPSHAYNSSGLKTVVLTANNCVSSDMDTIYIDVQNPGGFSINPSSLDILFPNCEDSITSSFWIINTGNGPLDISANPITLFDDFDQGSINSDIWGSVNGTVSTSCGSFSGNSAMYFNDGTNRSITTLPFSLNSDSEIGFHLHYGSGSSPCEQVDSGEGAVLEYSIDNGLTYNVIESYATINDYLNFTAVVAYPPADAIDVPTLYRIQQYNFSGSTNDHWAIDDFYIEGGNGDIVMNPESATIPQGDSILIEVTIYRDNLVAGDYNTMLPISTNDPLFPEYLLLVDYTIQGTGILSFEAPCIDFGTIQEFATISESVYLYNTGCGDILIDNMSASHPFFQFSTPSNNILANDSLLVDISFNPTAIGIFNETLNFTYDGIDTSICLTATSIGAPIISSNPTNLDLVFPNCEDSIVSNVWIYNTGNGPLDIQSTQGILTDDFDQGVINPNIWASTTGVLSSNCGSNSGSDALYFNNNNIREVITQPFTLAAGAQIGFSLQYGSGSFPCDLVESGKAISVGYSTNGGLSYTNIQSIGNITDYYSFADVLLTVPPGAVGISAIYRIRQANFIGSGSDNWAIDDFFIETNNNTDNIVSTNPNMATIPQGDSLLVEVTINRNEFIAGNYSNVFALETNDPQHPLFNIPINYTILGSGILSYQSNCVAFDTIQEFTTDINSIYLFNTGCDTLLIDDMISSNPYYQFIASTTNIPPYDSLLIDFVFAPESAGVFNDTLYFTYDGIDTTICLEGVSLGAPHISINPDPLNILFPNCEDSITTNIWIVNSGTGPLEFESSQTALFDDFDQSTVNSDIWDSTTGLLNNNCGSFSGNSALYFNDGTIRHATTLPLSLSSNASISFYLHYGSGSFPCEDVDSGEYVSLEYSTNGGNTFNTIDSYINVSGYNNFTAVVATPPADAIGVPTLYRIRQNSFTSSSYDHWAIDDFSITGGNSDDIVSLDPDSGTVPQGDSILVEVTIQRDDLTAGSYTTQYSLDTNDPQNLEFIIPINYTIEGVGILSFEAPCIDFGTIQEFDTVADAMYIYNTGCEEIIIDNMSASQAFFQFSTQGTNIQPNDSLLVNVSFNPTAIGIFNETLNFTYDGIDTSICLIATAVGAPVISSNPTSINVVFNNCENSVVSNLWIYNTGNGPLDFDINQASITDDFDQGTINSNIWSSTTGILSSNCGSNSGANALYFDNNFTREAVTQPLSLDLGTQIGFKLHYGSGNYPCDALESGKAVSIGYSTNGGLSYTNIQSFGSITDYYNFGSVVITVPPNAAGIPVLYRIRQANFIGSGYDNWAIDDFYIGAHNVAASPSMATIPQGDSLLVEVTIDRDGQIVGNYSDVLALATNDPQNPVYNIPIDYTILGDGILSYQSSCLTFDTIQEYTTDINSIYLYNTGCDTLLIDNLISSNPYYQFTASDSNIPPNDSLLIDFVFAPESAGTFNDTLYFTYDGIDSTICLEGVALGAPHISINPDSLDVLFPNCEDSITTSVWIVNSGTGPLEYEPSQIALFDDFDQNTVNSDIWDSTTGILSNNCGSFSGNSALYFNDGSFRQATTLPLSLSANTSISFYLHYGSGSSPCEDVDSGEYVSLEYSINGGATFNIVDSYTNTNGYFNFTNVVAYPPVDAVDVPTQYRIIQSSFSGSTNDHWAIDNFNISGGNNSDIIAMDPASGTVPEGDSLLVNITIQRDGLTAGNYSTQYSMDTNDPQNPQFIIPINYTIEGLGVVEIDNNCIIYPEIQKYSSALDSMLISNTGCDTLLLSNFTTSDPNFIVSQGNIMLEPNGSVYIPVTYNPTTTGIHNGFLLFDADGNNYQYCLEGTASAAAAIEIIPSPLVMTNENCDYNLSSDFTIYNNGDAPLDWNIAGSSIEDDFEANQINLNLWNPITIGNLGINCGTANSTQSLMFNNYGERSIQTLPQVINNQSSFSFNLIYGTSIGNCEELDNGEHVTLEYSTNGTSWFEINSYSNVTFYQNWTSITEVLPPAAYGLQTRIRLRQVDHSGSGYDVWAIDDVILEVANNNDLIVSPEGGNIPVSDSTLVNVSLDASSLPIGIYYDTILIVTNDPLNTLYQLPVEINIIDTTVEIAYNGPACENMGIAELSATITDSIYIENIGCGEMTLSNTSIPAPFMVIDAPSTIASNSGGWIVVSFNSDNPGQYTEQLIVESDGGNLSICIEASITELLPFTLEPDTLNINFSGCSDSLSSVIMIENHNSLAVPYTLTPDSIDDNGINISFSPSNDTLAGNSLDSIEMMFYNSETLAGTYEYSISLMYTDSSLLLADYIIIVNVPDIPCTSFNSEYTIAACQDEVQFTNETINDSGIWFWDFGDGTTSDEENPTHQYTQSGTYTVTFTNGTGASSSQFEQEVIIQTIDASFTYTEITEDGMIDFLSTNPAAVEWFWDFGDGNLATLESKSHTYTTPGQYIVNLQVWDENGCTGFLTDSIDYTVGLTGIFEHSIHIFPNPNSGQFTIKNDFTSGRLSMTLYDAVGKLIMIKELSTNSEDIIRMENMASGVYILEINLDDQVQFTRIVKE